ncbi:hypothetical protein EDD18DRAFT_1116996 [Armillaria luteobubalina]|uniref:Uncharacterized protein n=1 Tax=Armillaria luteobubalina TaxID=153913 RepID=A0AA39NY46_9AGAR|nr:hypothetical protein EDD18DRAFT_1116996 [Armillaria luteobubalina]
MKRKYASKARREREGKPAKAKAKGEQETYAHGSLLFLSLRHKADFQITLLVRTIRMEGGKLTTLMSNSLPSYAARLCKDAMLTGEGGEIERALEHLEGTRTEVQAAHDRIYSAAGICKEWTDMQETKGMSEIAELLGLAKVKLIKRWLTPYRDARDGKGPISVETLLEQLFLQFVDHYPFESTSEDAEKTLPPRTAAEECIERRRTTPHALSDPGLAGLSPSRHESSLGGVHRMLFLATPIIFAAAAFFSSANDTTWAGTIVVVSRPRQFGGHSEPSP